MKQSRYPSYDVMREKDAWDDHTQTIVTSRLNRVNQYQFLTVVETEMLRAICSLLAGDDRADVIQYVLGHIDQTLSESPGEGQRKAGVPPAQTLIREGLRALERCAQAQYVLPFIELDEPKQRQLVRDMSEGAAQPSSAWFGVPQKELFNKLLRLTVESYCSHPLIWSEIGYGGPAYPRGYVRTQLGQLDPWEAQPES